MRDVIIKQPAAESDFPTMKFLKGSRKVAPEAAAPSEAEVPKPAKTEPTKTQFFDLSILEQSVNQRGHSGHHATKDEGSPFPGAGNQQMMAEVIKYALVNTKRNGLFKSKKITFKQPAGDNEANLPVIEVIYYLSPVHSADLPGRRGHQGSQETLR